MARPLNWLIMVIVTCCDGIDLKQIPIVYWDELDDAIIKWFEFEPFVIRDSPLSQWSLTKYLQENSIDIGNNKLISYYSNSIDDRFSFIKRELRESNCCFTNSEDKCKEYVSSFIYKAFGNRLEFWEKYEINYKEKKQFNSCTNISMIENINMERVIDELYNIDIFEKENNKIKNSLYLNANIPYKMYLECEYFAFFDGFNINTKYGEWEIYLWISSQNAFANRHYDTTNNLFFILRGSKIFYLSPPSLSQFKIYSSLHSSWRQEILLFNHDNKIEIDNNPLIMEVILNENDVLYIPPLWYHKVYNLNTSTISTNLWWYSSIHQKIDEIWNVSIPIENNWNIYNKYHEIMYYIHHLLHKLNKKSLFISNNYFKIYPILYEMNKYLIQNNLYNIDKNWEWLQLFIDIKSIQKCIKMENDEQDIIITHLFNEAYHCSNSAVSLSKWNISINSFFNALNKLNSDGMKDILLSEVIEKMISFSINGMDHDSTLLPLLIVFSHI